MRHAVAPTPQKSDGIQLGNVVDEIYSMVDDQEEERKEEGRERRRN